MIDLHEESTIQRCQHDGENPYAIIARNLLRDETISFECRGFLAYLLSMKDGWVINVRQIMSHSQAFAKKDKIYSILNEALRSGYLRRIETYEKGLRRYSYQVSELPRFKESLRYPENPDAAQPCPGKPDPVRPDPENPDSKGIASLKEEHIKEDHLLPPSQARAAAPFNGTKDKMKKIFLDKGETETDFEGAWSRLGERIRDKPNDPILSIPRYLEKTLASIKESRTINEGITMFGGELLVDKHKRQAQVYDGCKINGDIVTSSDTCVTFSCGNFNRIVQYNIPHENWIDQTKIWFKGQTVV